MRNLYNLGQAEDPGRARVPQLIQADGAEGPYKGDNGLQGGGGADDEGGAEGLSGLTPRIQYKQTPPSIPAPPPLPHLAVQPATAQEDGVELVAVAAVDDVGLDAGAVLAAACGVGRGGGGLWGGQGAGEGDYGGGGRGQGGRGGARGLDAGAVLFTA